MVSCWCPQHGEFLPSDGFCSGTFVNLARSSIDNGFLNPQIPLSRVVQHTSGIEIATATGTATGTAEDTKIIAGCAH
eukprot:3172193-Amphidinium_carterae.1